MSCDTVNQILKGLYFKEPVRKHHLALLLSIDRKILIHVIFFQSHILRNDTELGLEAKKFTSSGLLVPDNLVTKVVLAELKANEDKSWLLDGRYILFLSFINASSQSNHYYKGKR